MDYLLTATEQDDDRELDRRTLQQRLDDGAFKKHGRHHEYVGGTAYDDVLGEEGYDW